MMNKVYSIYEWVLKRSTQQMMVFQVFVWLPLLFVFGYPLVLTSDITVIVHDYWYWMTSLGSIVLICYIVAIPLIIDCIKDSINNHRKNITK